MKDLRVSAGLKSSGKEQRPQKGELATLRERYVVRNTNKVRVVFNYIEEYETEQRSTERAGRASSPGWIAGSLRRRRTITTERSTTSSNTYHAVLGEQIQDVIIFMDDLDTVYGLQYKVHGGQMASQSQPPSTSPKGGCRRRAALGHRESLPRGRRRPPTPQVKKKKCTLVPTNASNR